MSMPISVSQMVEALANRVRHPPTFSSDISKLRCVQARYLIIMDIIKVHQLMHVVNRLVPMPAFMRSTVELNDTAAFEQRPRRLRPRWLEIRACKDGGLCYSGGQTVRAEEYLKGPQVRL